MAESTLVNNSVAECSVICGTVPHLRENSTILEIAEKFRIWKKMEFCAKKSPYGGSNPYVFGIIEKLFKNEREWWYFHADILKTF